MAAKFSSKLSDILLGLTKNQTKQIKMDELTDTMLKKGVKPDEIRASNIDKVVDYNQRRGIETLHPADIEDLTTLRDDAIEYGPLKLREYQKAHPYRTQSTIPANISEDQRFVNMLQFHKPGRQRLSNEVADGLHFKEPENQIAHSRGYNLPDFFGTNDRPTRIVDEIQSDVHQSEVKHRDLPFRKNFFEKMAERELGAAMDAGQDLAIPLGGPGIDTLSRGRSVQKKYYGDKGAKLLEKIAKRQDADFARETVDQPTGSSLPEDFDIDQFKRLMRVVKDNNDPDGDFSKAAKRMLKSARSSRPEADVDNFLDRLRRDGGMSDLSLDALAYDLKRHMGPENTTTEFGVIRPNKKSSDKFNLYNVGGSLTGGALAGTLLTADNLNAGEYAEEMARDPDRPHGDSAKYGDSIVADEYPTLDKVGSFLRQGHPFTLLTEGMGEYLENFGKPKNTKQAIGNAFVGGGDIVPGYSAIATSLIGELLRDR